MKRLKIIRDGEVSDYTNFAGNISLSNNTESLGSCLSFNLARNYNDKNFGATELVKVGDLVKLVGEKVVFSGIIVDIETSKFQKNVKCLDFHFYLNKNKLIVQMSGLNASAAIQNLFNEINVGVGQIENISTAITKIYKNNTVAEIIADILKQVLEETGEKYIVELDEEDKFNVMKYKKIDVKLDYQFTGNTTISESMNEMKNIVLVTSNDQEDMSILHWSEDSDSVEKYGMLQEIVQVEPDKNISNVRNIAETKLKELNKIFTSASIEVFGNDNLKSGRVLEVVNEEFGMKGSYLIKSCTHTWKKGRHITSLELEVN